MASNRQFINTGRGGHAHSTSSSSIPGGLAHNRRRDDDSSDSDDQPDLFNDRNDAEVLVDDPLDAEPMSFKRKPKQSMFSQLTGNRFGASAPSPNTSGNATPTQQRIPRPGGRGTTGTDGTKEGEPLDWYVEGPGRRVGYENLTAIDWIFEYTKERQRLRVLYSSATGVVGYLTQLLDSSQVWVILVLTGIAVGTVAAFIDVASDWLGDLKTGYCSAGPDGGAFYLNKAFCCKGYDQGDQCLDWKPWATALGVDSAVGKWILEYFAFLVFSVSFAVCSGFLVQEYSIYAKQSGIPEIKTVLGGFIIRRFLGAWTLLTKSLGLCLAVASGMWLGKEGPLVHVACCCANIFIKLFPNINNNEARKREVLSAAAASGISVAFGAPIGGVLFSLETLSYYFPDKTMWQSFVCAMTAAVVLQAFDPFRTGKLVLYQIEYKMNWHRFEIIPFAFLGLVGGITGGLFIKANMAVARWKKSSPRMPSALAQVAIAALITAAINYPNSYMRAQFSELVSSLLSDCALVLDDPFGLCKTGAASFGTIVLLLLAAVLGFFLGSITFGLNLPAGIILPSMALGALMGRALGIVMYIWQTNHPDFFAFSTCEPDTPCVTPGVYAIVGAGATLAGVTRMTVSIVVIMFELTGALTYVLPIMVAVMISKWIGDAFSRRGIYESWIHHNEYPFLDPGDEGGGAQQVPDVTAGQIMTRIEDLVVLTATGHTIGSLRGILDSCDYRGFPVVSDPRDAILLGYISRVDLAYNLATATSRHSQHGHGAGRGLPLEAEAFFSHQPLADPRTTLDLRPWMDQTPLTLPSRSSLHLAISYFQKLGLRYVLFCDRGALQGLLTKKDCWYVLNGAEETRRNMMAGSMMAGNHGLGSVGSHGVGAGGRGGEIGVMETGVVGNAGPERTRDTNNDRAIIDVSDDEDEDSEDSML